MKQICEISYGDFFTQKLVVKDISEHSWQYCKNLSIGKKVLHIGCSDYPLFTKETNMHIWLAPFTKELHGCDTHGIEQLREYHDGTYFNSMETADRDYDTILATNVFEHLKNPGLMVEQLLKIKFGKLFILVPNYFVSNQATHENEIFTEKIHPDHYAWYSPYTLWNLFKNFTDKADTECELNFFDNKNMISILIKNGNPTT